MPQDFPEIKFSSNWNNKLDCQVFPTFRVKSKKFQVGNIYRIWQGKTYKGRARIMAINVIKLDQVSDTIALLDTGYTKKEFIEMVSKMYKNFDFNIWEVTWYWIIFKYLKD